MVRLLRLRSNPVRSRPVLGLDGKPGEKDGAVQIVQHWPMGYGQSYYYSFIKELLTLDFSKEP